MSKLRSGEAHCSTASAIGGTPISPISRCQSNPPERPLTSAALAGEVFEKEAEGKAGVEPEQDPEAPPEPGETPRALAEGEAAEVGAGPRSRPRVFTIHAEAKLPNGAVYARDALVRLGGGAAYGTEGWKRGKRSSPLLN